MMEALKFDSSKPNLGLILKYMDQEFLLEVASVMEIGAKKYGYENWKKGHDPMRLISALMRHLWSWVNGVHEDEETGYSHLAHVACNAMFLWYNNEVHTNVVDE